MAGVASAALPLNDNKVGQMPIPAARGIRHLARGENVVCV